MLLLCSSSLCSLPCLCIYDFLSIFCFSLSSVDRHVSGWHWMSCHTQCWRAGSLLGLPIIKKLHRGTFVLYASHSLCLYHSRVSCQPNSVSKNWGKNFFLLSLKFMLHKLFGARTTWLWGSGFDFSGIFRHYKEQLLNISNLTDMGSQSSSHIAGVKPVF